MARRILLLTLAHLLLDPAVATPRDVEWNPNISAVQQQSSKALIVTVGPAESSIAYLKVCINDLRSTVCRGNVNQIESPANTFRYRVTGLASNQSYYIYVMPHSEDDHALDVWIHKQTPVFLQPWKQGSTATTTTQTPESTGPTAGPKHEGTGVRAEVVVVLVLVVVIAVATVCCLWHRGYLQRLWFLRCCFSQSLIAGPPIKVLQLYVPENQAFQQMAHKHMEFLKDYLRLDVADCAKMRQQQNPDQWLQRTSADRRVIVYMSPQLLAQLRSSDNNGNNNGGGDWSGVGGDWSGVGGDWSGVGGDCRLDQALPNSLSGKCVQFLHRITTAAALKKGRRRRRNPVFVLSGGFPSDEESELFLSQHGSLGALPRHWVSRQGQLADPGPLLTKLSGCHRSFFTASERLNSPRAQELQNAIGRLEFPADCCVDVVGGLELGLQADHNESAPMLPHRRAYDVTDHMYTPLPAPAGRGGREGPGPHRTDSGFSSAVDHNRCSNPSSEGNSSPGANSGEELMGEEEEEEEEPGVYSIITPYRGPLSISQMSIQFQAPEPVPGDLDSVVLTDNLNRINERGDSNWN